MAKRLAAFKDRARAAGIPAIYVNDNFGRWQSNFGQLLSRCLTEEVRGRPVAALLSPAPDDYFVLKPKHSAFFSTTLDILLKYLETWKTIAGLSPRWRRPAAPMSGHPSSSISPPLPGVRRASLTSARGRAARPDADRDRALHHHCAR
jgi:hypothetical protein